MFFYMAETLVSAVLHHCMTEEAEKCPVSVRGDEEDGAIAIRCGAALLLCPSCVLLPAPLCPSNRQSLLQNWYLHSAGQHSFRPA